MRLTATDLLLVIDVQNDFCPGGALAVAGGDAVVPLINSLARRFENVVVTQDWHPAGHSSFASSHPGAEPFSTIQMPYGPQTLWPDHCIQATLGSEFHPDLDLPMTQMVIRKGFRPGIDSYSAFFENDRTTATGLAGYMRERGLTRVFCAGLATDYCVRFSVEDARRLGFDATLVIDACRAIDLDGSLENGLTAMRDAGAGFVESTSIYGP